MLTEVKAYSSWRSAPTLPLNGGSAETDLIQIRNIDGLDPVKASINTTPFGSVDGESYVGSSVPSRNIVLTLHPNPNWQDWTYESLRRLLYSYFMPKRLTKLIFSSDDIPDVQISGYVEDCQVNMFSKDPELLVSIICPDPYFSSVNPKILTGQSVRPRGGSINIDYEGTIEAGINVKVTSVSGADPTEIAIQLGNPAITYFQTLATVNASMYFQMNSLPTKKFVQNVNFSNGVITNLLSKARIEEGSGWPFLQPGDNEFSVVTNAGVQDWTLTYFERFGGL